MTQFVHALVGNVFPVCKNRSQFELPLIGHTTKFCCPLATIVSPLIVQVDVDAVDDRKSGLYDVVVEVFTLRKSVCVPEARETVFEMVKAPAEDSGPRTGLPPSEFGKQLITIGTSIMKSSSANSPTLWR